MSSVLLPIGLGLSAGSQILGGISSYSEGKQEAKAAQANADIAMQQAKNQAAQERDKYRQIAAFQKTQYAASGLNVNEGTPLDVLAATDAEAEVSAMQLLYGGKLEAANWRNKAYAAKSKGSGSLFGGILGGIGTGLMGAEKAGWFKE